MSAGSNDAAMMSNVVVAVDESPAASLPG